MIDWWYSYLIQWSLVLGVLIVAIVCHELGHLYMFKKVGVKTGIRLLKRFKFRDLQFKIEVGDWKDYKNKNIKEMMNIYSYGIFAGLVPILIAIFFFDKFFMLAFIMYFVGCKTDIKCLYSLALTHKKML